MPRRCRRGGVPENDEGVGTLVEGAADGEEIVIAKSGKPKVRLVTLDDLRPLRKPGRGRGKWHVGKDFDEPLPDEIRAAFEGDESGGDA